MEVKEHPPKKNEWVNKEIKVEIYYLFIFIIIFLYYVSHHTVHP